MDYFNAEDLFPKEVLQKIKKYAAGKMVYFPKMKEKKVNGGCCRDKNSIIEKEIR